MCAWMHSPQRKSSYQMATTVAIPPEVQTMSCSFVHKGCQLQALGSA
jgi:hypothetical protein